MPDWNAERYHQLSSPQQSWGLKVLERLPLAGSERVLDLGCGTGRLTEELHRRLPRGRVVGLDRSDAMVDAASLWLAEHAPGAAVVQGDGAALPFRRAFDAVFSGATFHWILDHSALFRSIITALNPGGRLVAQCGGRGNVAAVKQAGLDVAAAPPYAQHLASWATDWQFATPEETEARLRAAGFTDVWCWLSRVDVDPGDPEAYLRAICLGSFLERLPAELHEGFVADALARLEDPLMIHYVRLNILARRR